MWDAIRSIWNKLIAPPRCMDCGAELTDENMAGENDTCAACWAKLI